MTRSELIIYLVSQGYSRNSLKILSFEELKRITLLTIAINWGEIEINKE